LGENFLTVWQTMRFDFKPLQRSTRFAANVATNNTSEPLDEVPSVADQQTSRPKIVLLAVPMRCRQQLGLLRVNFRRPGTGLATGKVTP